LRFWFNMGPKKGESYQEPAKKGDRPIFYHTKEGEKRESGKDTSEKEKIVNLEQRMTLNYQPKESRSWEMDSSITKKKKGFLKKRGECKRGKI